MPRELILGTAGHIDHGKTTLLRALTGIDADRLRGAPAGHFFDVITNGFGAMPPYGPIIQPPDRWRIVGFIRALQLSQDAKIDDVPQDQRNQIGSGGQ